MKIHGHLIRSDDLLHLEMVAIASAAMIIMITVILMRGYV